MKTTKRTRIDLRVTEDERAAIELAAQKAGYTLSRFILLATLEKIESTKEAK